MQFVDTRKGKVNWEGYDEIDITYTIEGKYVPLLVHFAPVFLHDLIEAGKSMIDPR